jgi:cytoskeleton protein RodZ
MKPGDQVEPTPPASGTALPPGGTDPVAEAPEGAVVAAAATPATQGSDRIPVPGAAPASVGDEAPPGPGASLAHARQALGWSVVEVARQLKLHPRQVEALEKDAFDRLRSPIYVRGFARNYARLVGADVPALMRALDERCPMPALVPPDPLLDIGVGATLPSADRPSRRYVRIALGVVLAVAIVAVVDRIWSPFSSEQAVAPAAVTTPVEPSPLLGAGAEQPAGPEAPAASGGSISPVPATGESPPAAAPAPQSQTPAARTVRLAFERESWVEIRDASGQVILSGVNRAGTEQVVKGLAPLAVVVGNASGVRVDYEARRVDLQPHTLVNVARLTLD